MSSPVWNLRRVRTREAMSLRRLRRDMPWYGHDVDPDELLRQWAESVARWPATSPHPLDALDSLDLVKGRPSYRNRQGEPITARQWVERRADDHRVAREQVVTPDGAMYDVSTVHLGLDHGWGDGPPMIFETLVFGAEADPWTDVMLRYSTEAQAQAGHDRVLWAITHGHHPDALDDVVEDTDR